MTNHKMTSWKTGPYDPRIVFDGIGEEVCTVHNAHELAVPQARLIAAAPDLLAALEAVTNIIENQAYTNDHGFALNQWVKNHSRPAIAKARGE